MRQISFKRHRFSQDVIRYAVWLYFRFTMSLRDVEELETLRRCFDTVESENDRLRHEISLLN